MCDHRYVRRELTKESTMRKKTSEKVHIKYDMVRSISNSLFLLNIKKMFFFPGF